MSNEICSVGSRATVLQPASNPLVTANVSGSELVEESVLGFVTVYLLVFIVLQFSRIWKLLVF